MPENGDRGSVGLDDKLFRYRDCAVINFMHDEIARDPTKVEPFDTVRGMFQEGPPAFEGAGFRAKSHTQIAVINSDCIKGYFRPRPYPA